MFKKLFSVDKYIIRNAVVTGVLASVFGYILTVGNVFHLDWKELINVAVLSGIGVISTFLGTNKETGTFAGAIKLKQGDIKG